MTRHSATPLIAIVADLFALLDLGTSAAPADAPHASPDWLTEHERRDIGLGPSDPMLRPWQLY